MSFAHYLTGQWGLPDLLVSIMTGIGGLFFLIMALGLLYVVFTLVIVQWLWRAIYFSVILVYYQYRVKGSTYWLSENYLKKHPHTWGVRFIFGRLFSPRKMIGLSSSRLEMPDLYFNFRGYFPTHSRSKDLQAFIDNGWKMPDEPKSNTIEEQQ